MFSWSFLYLEQVKIYPETVLMNFNCTCHRFKFASPIQILTESLTLNLWFKFYHNWTLNKLYIERIYQMSYSWLSDNEMLQIFSFLIKWLYGTLQNCFRILMAIFFAITEIYIKKYKTYWKIVKTTFDNFFRCMAHLLLLL